MRRSLAVVLILALMVAPTALFAGAWKCACARPYCTMAQGQCTCPMMLHERDNGPGPAVRCNCMRYPDFGLLAPLTEMILTQPVPMPGIVRTASERPAVAMAVLPGFLPSPFHPPRG